MTGRRLVADASTRLLAGGTTVVGGDPLRALTLSPAGAPVARALLSGHDVPGEAAATLSARLVSAGIAHPRARPAPTDEVTLLIPVRDRAAALDRCLAAAGAVHRAIVVDDGSGGADAAAIAAVCERRGATLIRRARAGGPAAARNAGLAAVDTELVAFLDSDCVPDPGWLALLCGVLTDPAVGAAAPRIRPLVTRGPVARYAAARCPLDLGAAPARVRPGGRVAYVPTAALLARRAALGAGFDEGLRYGEDVDLIWRMHDAGWMIRYEPAAGVGHAEPARARHLARRRFRYGSAAGPLARRHPDRLAPVRLHPRPTAAIALAVAGAPRGTALAAAVHVAATTRTLKRAGVPPHHGAGLALRGLADSTVAVGRAATMITGPLLVAGLTHRRTRPASLALLAAEPARGWWRARPPLDPVRWAALAIADDVAYGAGVWAGAARARTLRPLLPARSRP